MMSEPPIDQVPDYVDRLIVDNLRKDVLIKELKDAMREIEMVQPLDVFGPMSNRMRKIAIEALKKDKGE